MPQITHGIRSVLSIPSIYSWFEFLLGSSSCYATFVAEYVQPKIGERILDIGCGPADILHFLPKVEYVGFDASAEYIEAARKRFGDRATFYCEQVNTRELVSSAYFDIVLAVGVLHHLGDAEALQLCQLAQAGLKPGGTLITLDGCYVKQQSPITQYLLDHDRGQNVRDQEGYLQIISQVFSNTTVSIRHDLLRIPYTHIIIKCTK